MEHSDYFHSSRERSQAEGEDPHPCSALKAEEENAPSRSSSMKTGAAKAVRCVDVKPSRKHMLIAE